MFKHKELHYLKPNISIRMLEPGFSQYSKATKATNGLIVYHKTLCFINYIYHTGDAHSPGQTKSLAHQA